jgi:predicted dienelactone hydrolase
MKATRFHATLVLCLLPTAAHAAGIRLIEVPADAASTVLSGAMWYPCSQPPQEVALGPLTVRGTKDCPFSGDRLPLIVFSHGNVGAFYDHHDTAEALADAGFVVGAISHRGDNAPPTFTDGADPSVMLARPLDIRRLITFMTDKSPAAPHIDASRIGFFGFSAGGHTGLVLLGATPDWAVALCRFSVALPACTEALKQTLQGKPVLPEGRIKAAVLADPGAIWISLPSVRAVRKPLQLWASETAGRGLPNIALAPGSVAALERNLRAKHEYHEVPNAGHFAFMLCGPSISAVPEYCKDASGFDRVEFHRKFNAEVLRFFRAQFPKR